MNMVLSENKKPRLYNRGFCCGPIRTSGLDQVDLIFRSGTPQSIFLDADCGFSVRNLCRFPTQGKERCKYMPILSNNNNNNNIISKNSNFYFNNGTQRKTYSTQKG